MKQLRIERGKTKQHGKGEYVEVFYLGDRVVGKIKHVPSRSYYAYEISLCSKTCQPDACDYGKCKSVQGCSTLSDARQRLLAELKKRFKTLVDVNIYDIRVKIINVR